MTKAPTGVRLPHVALVIETETFYGRRILSGVASYVRKHRPWSMFLGRHKWDELPRWLRGWQGDGILCRSLTPSLAEFFQRSNAVVVNLDDRWSHSFGLPQVRSDDPIIGRLAAEHLLECGFRHFAFCGFSAYDWSLRRKKAFTTALGAASTFHGAYEIPLWEPNSRLWEQEQDAIGRWLLSLPRPLAVLACNDFRGRYIVDACQRVKLAVPEEVAVVGVDDDALLCELCNPPLSSVAPNPEGIGYEAAALLDRLMAGERISAREWLVAPLGITLRQSSDVLAIDDADTVAAIRYIREHACQGITVREVLRQVPLSRTLLEWRFRKYLGHSPKMEIRSVQLKRVKQLLVQTELSLERIAELAGYKHSEYLNVVFKRLTGQTPGRYRRQRRSANEPSFHC